MAFASPVLQRTPSRQCTVSGYGMTVKRTQLVGGGSYGITLEATDAIGSATLRLTGLPAGVEVRIRRGSKTIAHAQDVAGGVFEYGYSYGLEIVPVRIQFTLSGFIFEDLTALLSSKDQSITVIWSPDPSYTSE